MRDTFRKAVIAAATVIAIGATTVALPTSANARWGGGWHGGGWHGGGGHWHGGWRGGGWGWGLAGLAVGTGFALAATAPYYGGYYGYYDDPYYYGGYGGYRPYAYGYGYPYGYRRAAYYRYGWHRPYYRHVAYRRWHEERRRERKSRGVWKDGDRDSLLWSMN